VAINTVQERKSISTWIYYGTIKGKCTNHGTSVGSRLCTSSLFSKTTISKSLVRVDNGMNTRSQMQAYV